MSFSEGLKALRKKNNLTQEELAKKLYVSQSAIYTWERGKREPNIEMRNKIAKALHVDRATLEEWGERSSVYDLVDEIDKDGNLILSSNSRVEETRYEVKLFRAVSNLNDTNKEKVYTYALDLWGSQIYEEDRLKNR